MVIVVLKLILIGFMTVLGWIIVPVGLTIQRVLKLKRMPEIFIFWDNDRDGIHGDNGYRFEHCPKMKLIWGSFICDYIWLAWRNPCANLCWILGVTEIITELKVKDRWSYAKGESGKIYPLYHYIGWLGEFYIGYKNDNVQIGKYVPYNIGIAVRGNFLWILSLIIGVVSWYLL